MGLVRVYRIWDSVVVGLGAGGMRELGFRFLGFGLRRVYRMGVRVGDLSGMKM